MDQICLTSGCIGSWELDPITQNVYWDNCSKTLFGFCGNDCVSFGQLLFLIHTNDRAQVSKIIQQTLDHKLDSSFDIQFQRAPYDSYIVTATSQPGAGATFSVYLPF